MEVRGNIWDIVFVKSKIRKIQIGEGGTSYCVQPEGVVDWRSCLLEVDAEDIMFEADAAGVLKAEEQSERPADIVSFSANNTVNIKQPPLKNLV